MVCLRRLKQQHIFYFLVFLLLGLGTLWSMKWKHRSVIINDTTSYYSYLPAVFLYDDLKELQFLQEHPELGVWVETNPQGVRHFKMTCGLAILWTPAFLITVALAPDTEVLFGYDWPFHLAISLTALLIGFFGFVALNEFLKRHFKNSTAWISSLAVFFGSNMLYYTINDAGMSHAYNFSLIAFLLFGLHKLSDKAFIKLVGLGFIMGLVVLIRPTNALLLLMIPLVLLFLNQIHWKELFSIKVILSLALGVLLGLLPQFLYWYHISGEPVMYSYGKEGFFFGFERVLLGLFGFRKGLFVYAPGFILLLLAPFLAERENRTLAWINFGFFSAFSLVIFSWWCWWYGGGFGSRSMIDFFPLAALSIASVLDRFKIKWALFLIGAALLHNFWFTYQFVRGKVHYDSMTSEAYAKILTFRPNDITGDDLISPDYDGALNFGRELHYKGNLPYYISSKKEFEVIAEQSFTSDTDMVWKMDFFYYNHPDYISDTIKVVTLTNFESGRELWEDASIYYDSNLDKGWVFKSVKSEFNLNRDSVMMGSAKLMLYNPRTTRGVIYLNYFGKDG